MQAISANIKPIVTCTLMRHLPAFVDICRLFGCPENIRLSGLDVMVRSGRLRAWAINSHGKNCSRVGDP
jgi:hypothetical protein